ncbi:putative uncharacterized protein YKR104W [Folsomia candida]|uniref:putative uncharacterized protein YKR104W n=1 Tax=Folsomia candida TaxID=158441 RepID=UPI0016054307|nr:putative uncharacterized protein YKR104W [Folsomia candida]
MSFTIWLNYGMMVSADVENSMVATERVVNFAKNTPTEEEDKGPSDSPTWIGSWCPISFRNFSLRYTQESSDVLQFINFEVTSGLKVGVVGRTAAGKSSIFAALFRLTDPNTTTPGGILVDGKDILEQPLHTVRRSITMVPQHPVIFQGTLRFNLDPNNEYDDIQMNTFLRDIGLKQSLDFKIDGGGSNLAAGERQQLSLVRALLRLLKTPIFALDEATANIDSSTEENIQKILKERLQRRTVLTIAHRLETVVDSDKILVLREGKVVEYDTPQNLIKNPNSEFLAMIEKNKTQKRDELLDRIRASEN